MKLSFVGAVAFDPGACGDKRLEWHSARLRCSGPVPPNGLPESEIFGQSELLIYTSNKRILTESYPYLQIHTLFGMHW